MLDPISPLTALQNALAAGTATPLTIAADVIAKANGSHSHNTYLHFDSAALLLQAEALTQASSQLPLYSIPISLKDCFDLAGTVTTAGSRFYAERTPIATEDSAVAQRLHQACCLITGKTHLHPLAYGITGQSSDFGDALQPRDPALLTGGSSSGAGASVQEGSALAAIGTDTGGSIRVPAALCGLVGFRASHALAAPSGFFPNAWAGATHLAPSFDTLGILLRDPRDAAPIAQALFNIPAGTAPTQPRIGCVPLSFLLDSTPDVLETYAAWRLRLTAAGAALEDFDTSPWAEAVDIFAPLQAYEASQLHRGNFDHFEASIAQRLHWGASLAPAELATLRQRHEAFRHAITGLFARFDFLILPAASISRLFAAADHSATRAALLRYTAPFSLGGFPVLTLPGELIGKPFGTAVQLAAAPTSDASLLAYATQLGTSLAP